MSSETPSTPRIEASDGQHDTADAPQTKDGPADSKTLSSEDRRAAASLIQRNYRGYRDRRALQGLGLDASTRWLEAVREAQYRQATSPTSRAQRHSRDTSDAAKQNWKRITAATRRAGGDDTSETEGDPSMTAEELDKYRQKKLEQKHEREKHAKMMDLSYYLEMVDTKHRYGSHLRAYHAEWKKADTNENFFYWLDHGEGRSVEIPNVSREKLEADQVRYLSREDRLQYLVKIDDEGRLTWAKNGERITTSAEYRDSVGGIVRREDRSPAWNHEGRRDSSSSVASSMSASSAAEEAQHYVNHEYKQAKGLKKLQKVNVAVIFNHLLQSTVKPGTWIFVADTSMRLYVGIKQSGAFQHSSFLHGARLSAAGLIKIKEGQLRSLSPLSGHYRPPTRNFRAFVHSLKDSGVDMSRVSISKSYAVLLGLEAYQKSTKKLKHAEQHVKDEMEKVTHPEEAAKREEASKDKSKSAQKEREYLEKQRTRNEELKSQTSRRSRFLRKLGIRSKSNSISDASALEPAPSSKGSTDEHASNVEQV